MSMIRIITDEYTERLIDTDQLRRGDFPCS
jgi:hypothetical protein